MPTYTKREQVTVDGRAMLYVEGHDGDGDFFVGYEAIPDETVQDDPLVVARARLSRGGTALTKQEQLALLDRLLGTENA